MRRVRSWFATWPGWARLLTAVVAATACPWLYFAGLAALLGAM